MATLRITKGGLSVNDRARGVEIALADWRAGVRPEAGRFELVIPNTENVEALADIVARFDAVVLEFPDFKDGRAYSQARILRERLNYAGEIRARGDVLCDQALFMVRAGFDALEIGEGDPQGFCKAIASFSAYYQSGADGSAAVSALRARRRQAA